jgi:tRNA-2-methylthio-N6-dimethylallyladenosine synthase
MPRERRFFIETFGCQMNVNDSEKVAGLLLAEGYERVADAAQADFVFVNTCAVREKASRKLDHALDRFNHLRKHRPELRIGVGGCVAQLQQTQILERAPHVDVLVGTHNLSRVPELLQKARSGSGRQVDLDRRADSFQFSPDAVAHTSTVRAYVTATEGCNHVCSFCVVPRTRGPEVCRDPEAIVDEVQSLVARGYAEVMLLGQSINAYRHGDTDFAGLLSRVNGVRGLSRLRFTTSHPSHVGERLANAFRDLDKLCPYLHLPVQSGSDAILRDMRRGYTRSEYVETVGLLRERVPNLALSSDVIVGYPGENEEDFQATLDLVAEMSFEGLFTFTYSPRPGTTATRRTDDVTEEEKSRRLHLLNDQQQRAQKVLNAGRVGTRERVLVDGIGADGRLSGRTPRFQIVHLEGPAEWLGRIAEVEITCAGPNSLVGRRA